MQKAIYINITGKVQGVGFRPFVFNLAKRLGLKGDVWNDSAGVSIRLLMPCDWENFLKSLQSELPPLAKIETIQTMEVPWEGQQPSDFTIKFSQKGEEATDIVADAATCPQCLAEMKDPNNRRYRYPFINCTHCGPRFTIIKEMPYDRPATSMAKFKLCEACAREYHDPTDRRFHAQPVACPECGPAISGIFSPHTNLHTTLKGEKALQQAIKALKLGQIIALKGLGGFHLACLATEDAPIQLLRERKHRPSKPFAVMLPHSDWLSQICADHINLKHATEVLSSTISPITLLEQSATSPLSSLIAPDLHEVGLMLPANPLQTLLLEGVDAPLVMTSGNASGHAPALSNEEALASLSDIADFFLFHNREIVERADDSVLRFDKRGTTEILRRGRGLAPDSFALPQGFPTDQTILAIGGDLKNSFALLHRGRIFTSPHFGDLNQPDVFAQWQKMLEKFPKLYHAKPEILAYDAHPAYLSHQWAQRQKIPALPIYHHHAHLAACLGENHVPLKTEKKFIGLTLDGLGYGKEGNIWGGECFLANYLSFEWLGGLPPVPLLGGDLAAKEPWRNLLAQFNEFVPDWEKYAEANPIKKYPYSVLLKAAKSGINAPLASSCGRLFEAIACALSIAPEKQSYEGEAACCLEAFASAPTNNVHPLKIPLKGNQLDLETFWQNFLDWNAPKAAKAWGFHDALAKGFADLAKHFAEIYQSEIVVLSGGCLHNRLLKERLQHHLAPLKLLIPSQLPAGDGGIAFGQALIALAQTTAS
ncbi:carbamoyltransferase HypF [Acetobacteraceae bacterium]|nr:carbamoyltransferase HypF [Acetobacteraceae bacterium]